jgi:4-hydroxybenzoate polyprenyltransferase
MLKTLKRLVLIARPSGWLPIASVFAGGALTGHQHLGPAVILGLLFTTVPLGLIAYGVNDISDKEADARNYRKGKMTGALLTPDDEKRIKWAAPLLALAYLAFNLLSNRPIPAVCVFIICLLSLAYSLEPLRLKTWLGLDIAVNGVGMVMLFIYGFTAASTVTHPPLPAPHMIGIIFFAAAAFHSLFALADYEVDLAHKVSTTVVRLGKSNAIGLTSGFFLIDFILSVKSSRYLMLYFGLCILAMLFLYLKRSSVVIYRTLGVLALLIPVVAAKMFVF